MPCIGSRARCHCLQRIGAVRGDTGGVPNAHKICGGDKRGQKIASAQATVPGGINVVKEVQIPVADRIADQDVACYYGSGWSQTGFPCGGDNRTDWRDDNNIHWRSSTLSFLVKSLARTVSRSDMFRRRRFCSPFRPGTLTLLVRRSL